MCAREPLFLGIFKERRFMNKVVLHKKLSRTVLLVHLTSKDGRPVR